MVILKLTEILTNRIVLMKFSDWPMLEEGSLEINTALRRILSQIIAIYEKGPQLPASGEDLVEINTKLMELHEGINIVHIKLEDLVFNFGKKVNNKLAIRMHDITGLIARLQSKVMETAHHWNMDEENLPATIDPAVIMLHHKP
jgi:hypothetical protein